LTHVEFSHIELQFALNRRNLEPQIGNVEKAGGQRSDAQGNSQETSRMSRRLHGESTVRFTSAPGPIAQFIRATFLCLQFGVCPARGDFRRLQAKYPCMRRLFSSPANCRFRSATGHNWPSDIGRRRRNCLRWQSHLWIVLFGH
jgi:hypothetical protein